MKLKEVWRRYRISVIKVLGEKKNTSANQIMQYSDPRTNKEPLSSA